VPKRSLEWACAKATARRTSVDGNGTATGNGNGVAVGDGSMSAKWDIMSKKDEMDAALALCGLLHGVA